MKNLDLDDKQRKSDEYYLMVGLNSGLENFDRVKKLNVCIVLDISGSMSCSLDTETKKLDIAKEALVSVLQSLRNSDRVAITAFNSVSITILPMTKKPCVCFPLVRLQTKKINKRLNCRDKNLIM